jgi:hypothetical protein
LSEVAVEATTSSAMQTQEPQVNIVPSLSTALVKLNDAIEFFDGSLMNTPT